MLIAYDSNVVINLSTVSGVTSSIVNMDADAKAVANLNASSNRVLIRMHRCNIQGCKVTEEKGKIRCSCGECNKLGHPECYVIKILNGIVQRNHFVNGVNVGETGEGLEMIASYFQNVLISASMCGRECC